jgi:hypothetical protein
MDRSMVLDMGRIPGYQPRKEMAAIGAVPRTGEWPRFATLLGGQWRWRRARGASTEALQEAELQHGDRQQVI